MYKGINPSLAYEKGMRTWAKWIDLNLDPRRTKVFFRTMSPRHNKYYYESMIKYFIYN